MNVFVSTIGGATDAPSAGLRLEAGAPGLGASLWPGWTRPWGGWSLAARRRARAQAVIVDAGGAWAWALDDRYGAPTRHADVAAWMRRHPGEDLRLWVAADLMRDGPHLAEDAMVRGGPAIDLPALRQHGLEHGIRIVSVMPWWRHACAEVHRCVPRLARAAIGEVGIVEGRRLAWLTSERGVLRAIRHVTLPEASQDALRAAMQGLRSAGPQAVSVVAGQGLADGAAPRALDALVLGRLDGEQPPQWLRPCTRRLR